MMCKSADRWSGNVLSKNSDITLQDAEIACLFFQAIWMHLHLRCIHLQQAIDIFL